MIFRPGLAAGALLGLLALAPGPAPAAVRTVTKCDGHPDGADAPASGLPGQLRRLINDANDGDIILIPAGCTITLVGPSGDDNNLNGDLDIKKDLTIQGAGPGRSILDGAGTDRLLEVHPGAIVAVSGLTLRNGRVLPLSGGGVLVHGTLTLSQVHVTGNVADNGGGIFVFNGTLVLSDVTVSDNQAPGGGSGGGIVASGSSLRMTNVTVSGNRAHLRGGGLFLAVSDAILRNVTVAGNSVDADPGDPVTGGGLLVLSGGAGVQLRNTVISGNIRVPAGTPDDCGSVEAVVSAGSNLVQTAADCTGLLPSDLTSVDPLLGPLAPNGGATPTHALLPGSLAIDAGDGGCAPVDQRGVPRPQGLRCDIGAFEAGAGTAGAFPDFDGDGRADPVVAAGPGGPGEIRVLSGATGAVRLAFTPFGPGFPGALSVAVCDLTGDGVPDLVVGALGPAGSELRTFDGVTVAPLPAPLGVMAAFGPPAAGAGRAGVLAAPAVACADVDGDGTPDLIAGAPAGAAEGPLLRVFSGRDATLLREDLPFGAAFRGGVTVGP